MQSKSEAETVQLIQKIVRFSVAYPTYGTAEELLSRGNKPWYMALLFTSAAASWNFYFSVLFLIINSGWIIFKFFTDGNVNIGITIASFILTILFRLTAKKMCNYAFAPFNTILCLILLASIDILLLSGVFFGIFSGVVFVVPLIITMIAVCRWGGYKHWFEHMERKRKIYNREWEDNIDFVTYQEKRKLGMI